MIRIEISQKEITRLVGYIEHASQHGHFGGGEIEMPEEELLIRRIKECSGILELSFSKFNLLLEFIYDAIGQGTAVLVEDVILFQKLLAAVELYHQEIRRVNKLDLIENTIKTIRESLLLQKKAAKTAKKPIVVKTDEEIAAENAEQAEKVARLAKKMELLDKLAKGTS